MTKTIFDILNDRLKAAFEAVNLPSDHVSVQLSDRPDLADFQCNSAFQLAKSERKNPRELATLITEQMALDDLFEKVEVAGPGFINLVINRAFLAGMLSMQQKDPRCGVPEVSRDNEQTIVIDYGGPNVAKPLHVGHLRPSIIGEAIKRTARFSGHYVIGDIHLGDWGTPMGMLLAELQERHPDWVYFDADKTSDFPKEPPFGADALISLYPEASTHFKEDAAFADKARQATAELQEGRPGYKALWKHFRDLSLGSMRENFEALNVDFDLWLGESDVHDMIPDMIADLREKGLVVESDGALIIPVAEDSDKEDIPPMMLVKKDGGYTYATTDLATIYDRRKKYNPQQIIYVVDTRQSLHFKQVFRAAAKAGYMPLEQLSHVNFGTINGTDGKPYKTRQGGIMQLSQLIEEARIEAVKQAGYSSMDAVPSDMRAMIDDIAVAAVKFGDLSTTRQADYVFDLQSFVKAEGRTGPYIQYAAVRIKSILEKAGVAPRNEDDLNVQIIIDDEAEKELALKYLELPAVIAKSIETSMPSQLCEHVYLLAKAFNRFYRSCPVATESDAAIKASRIALCQMVLRQIELVMEVMLGIDLPDRMLRAETEEDADAA